MIKLTFDTIESRFIQKYPHGSLTKQNNTYSVYFDSRDTRSEAEKEIELYHNVITDKRKLYTYKANNLTILADKLKLDVSDIAETKLSKVNQEWEAMLKVDTDYSFELFGE